MNKDDRNFRGKGSSGPKGGKSTPPKKKGNKRSASWNDRQSRDEHRDYERREKDDKLYPLNDFSWYNRYPELAEGAGRIPFPYRPGRTLNFEAFSASIASNSSTVTVGMTDDVQFGIPGVMRLDWVPSFSSSDDVLSPVSIAAKELYAKIRSSFSGALDADPPDLVMYLGALDSIFSYISWLKRLYGVLDYYGPNNYVTPDGVLTAMGFNNDTIAQLRANKDKLWYNINTLVHMTQKFRMPAVMDLFKRHFWMNSNIYADAPTANSQYYMFNQVGFYQFAMLEVPGQNGVTAGGLQMVAMPSLNSGTDVVGTLFNFGQSLIKALAESDDGYTISGYFMRAFEGVPDFTTTLLELEPTFNPVYVEEVLSQIENSKVLGNSLNQITGLDVRQNPKNNTIICNPKKFNASQSAETNFVSMSVMPLTSRSDVPSVEDVFINTRLMACVDEKGNIICGTEIPLRWTLFYPASEGTWTTAQINAYNTSIGANPTISITQLMAAAFDWAPLVVYLTKASSAATTWSSIYFFGDIHNLTGISTSDLSELHRVSVYSELNAFTA